jgi:hypothetical protein
LAAVEELGSAVDWGTAAGWDLAEAEGWDVEAAEDSG